jgi:hypothetical protein
MENMVMTDSSDPFTLGEMARGYFRGKLLCAAVRLGIADVLGDDEKSLDELALQTAADPNAASARFALTPFGRPLRRDLPNSVWASIVFWADLIADSWTYLADCARSGGRAGVAVAMEREGVKSRWSLEPNSQAIFHAVFAEPTAEDMAPIMQAHDFTRYRVVADLGGAGGGLLAAILLANPQTHGILVDRKEAIAGAASKLRAIGLADRCDFLAGDLLEAVPQGADAYILKFVLHGYNDGNARRILQNCHTATTTDSRLLLIEVVLPAKVDRADPALEKMLMGDINMLAVTGGRERSESEWSSLLSSAGYELHRIVSIPGQTFSIIEAVASE